jgi:hypothetical protein
VSGGNGPRGALRVGARVRFDERVFTVAGLEGTMVRLLDDRGVASLVVFSYLLASDGFELLGSAGEGTGLPPFGLLDTVPEAALRKAQWWERHLTEVETGLEPDAAQGTRPRPEYDPDWRTITERIEAKAAELTASGYPVSERTLSRLRGSWRDQGLWGLVDGRATRFSNPAGHCDERLVQAVTEVMAAQEHMSTGTRARVMRQAERLLAERHGEGVVPVPSRATF